MHIYAQGPSQGRTTGGDNSPEGQKKPKKGTSKKYLRKADRRSDRTERKYEYEKELYTEWDKIADWGAANERGSMSPPSLYVKRGPVYAKSFGDDHQ